MIRRPPRSTLLSLHDALPIWFAEGREQALIGDYDVVILDVRLPGGSGFDLCADLRRQKMRSEHTSELQSPCNLVCRLLLEKKKKTTRATDNSDCRKSQPTIMH